MLTDHRNERKSIHLQAFEHYMRTGERLTEAEWLARQELKFNPYHDAAGRFTSPPGVTVSYGKEEARITNRPKLRLSRSEASRATAAVKNPVANEVAKDRRGAVGPKDLSRHRNSITHTSNIIPPQKLRDRASAIIKGQNELLKMPNMNVVLFGPGVSLMPVPVATFQDFDGAAKMATKMHDLDAVITGPQFDLTLIGSETLHGQAVIGGRVFGNSAPGLYYFKTVTGLDGVKKLEFAKGDPPRNSEVGIGGGVPMIFEGRDVPGYNLAWSSHRGNPGMGKNIVAYNSTTNRSAVFVQKEDGYGQSLKTFVDYIKYSGFDYALMFDGSGSASLNYRGESVVDPELRRQLAIPLGIGFRSK